MNFDELRKTGWIEIKGVASRPYALSLAEALGKVVPHPNGDIVNTIKPKISSEAMKGTFSGDFGLGEFPLHTDTAFWSKPARYIVMWSSSLSKSGTYILPTRLVFSELSEKSCSLVRDAVYLINIPSGKYYSSLIFRESNCEGLRFDPCCMVPVNHSAKYVHGELMDILPSLETKEVCWNGNKILVIDNWKSLHGRRAIQDCSENRELNRIYVSTL